MKRGPSIATRAYIAAMSVGAVVAAGILWGNHPKAASLAMFVVLAAVGAIAHAYPIQGFRHQAYQVTLPFIVIAGPMLVMALGAGPWTMLFTAGPLLLARPALSSLIGRRQPALRSPLSRAA